MTIQAAQKQAIEEIINVLVHTSPPRGKRQLSAMFMDLVDRVEYPEYYEVCCLAHSLGLSRLNHDPLSAPGDTRTEMSE